MNWLKKYFAKPPLKPRRVEFYTRAGCHLCDDALLLLGKHAQRYQLKIEIIDIEHNPKLEALYGHEIPVVFIDGKKRFFGQVDPILLRRLLEKPTTNT